MIKEYMSIRDAANELNIKITTKISEVAKGKRKSAYGFLWKYSV